MQANKTQMCVSKAYGDQEKEEEKDKWDKDWKWMKK